MNIPLSVITTVRNEAPNVRRYIENLNRQSLLPCELIVVDAESTDGTADIFRAYPSAKFPIRVFSLPCTRGKGRNFAVDQAIEDIIVSIDAGVNPDPFCLEKISDYFSQNSMVSVASGRVVPAPENLLEEAFSFFLPRDPTEDDLKNRKWLPGSRLFAFHKDVFKMAGGYPEKQNTAEDIPFVQNIINLGYYIGFIPDSTATYEPCKNWTGFFKQYFGYSVGDGLAYNFSAKYTLKILIYLSGIFLFVSGFIHSMCWLILGICVLAYFTVCLIKFALQTGNIKIIILGPVLEIVNDVAEVSGFITGCIRNYLHKRFVCKKNICS